jgi:two-component system cell cycle response regulator DivK
VLDRSIRTKPSLSRPPLLVAPYALAGDEEKALAAGCDAILQAYSPRELLAKVRAYLA